MARAKKEPVEAFDEDDEIQESEETEAGEQAEMFPELDLTNPTQKSLLAAARKYTRDKAERDALLSTCKEKVDNSMAKVIALMHECGLKHFKHKGVEAELITTRERIQVRIETEDNDDDE